MYLQLKINDKYYIDQIKKKKFYNYYFTKKKQKIRDLGKSFI